GGVEHGDEDLAADARVDLYADGLRAGASGAQRPQDRLLQQSVALVEGVVRREEEPDDGDRGGLCARIVDAEHAVQLASPLALVLAPLRHAPPRPGQACAGWADLRHEGIVLTAGEAHWQRIDGREVAGRRRADHADAAVARDGDAVPLIVVAAGEVGPEIDAVNDRRRTGAWIDSHSWHDAR